MTEKPFSQYADRNGEPILDVLRMELSAATSVLEIGSGTGQHAVQFAAALPHVVWQTSDLEENHPGISAWVKNNGSPNLRLPLAIDVRTAALREPRYDAVYSANTAHIMSLESVAKMFALVGKVLADSGVFCLYGPFRQQGEFNAASNAAFHQSLRSRDPAMGVRHLEALDDMGMSSGLLRRRLYAMPANNCIAVWCKETA